MDSKLRDTLAKSVAQCFKEISNFPTLTTAWFDGEEGVYHSIWSQKHPVTKSKISTQSTLVNGYQTDPVPIADYGLMSLNRSQHNKHYKKAYIYNKKDNKDTTSYLDIYTKEGLAFRHDLTSYEMHGKVNDDCQFGCLVWSPNGTHLAYIAEKKVPCSKSFFDYIKKETDETVRGEEYRYSESWGEQLADAVNLVICIIEISTGEIDIPQIPPDISPLDLVWSKSHLYFIGARNEPFKLGIIYCTNRETKLYSMDNNTKECIAVTEPDKSVLSPRLEQGGQDRILFLESLSGGPHRTYSTLKIFTPGTGTEEVPGGTIYTIPDSDEMTGICGVSLPRNPWVDQHHILCGTTDKWRNIIICIDIRTGCLKYSLNETDVNYSIIDQIGPKALISMSKPNDIGGFQQQVYLITLGDRMIDTQPLFNKDVISEEICTLKGYDFETDKRQYNGILLTPKKNDKNTLLVFPHGGPHGTSVVAFNASIYGFCKLGYSILQINYTGSLGIDKKSVYKLGGHVGRVDVDDVHSAVLHVMKEVGFTKVGVMGGSHGGFLTAHLIGQFPDVYKAAVMRNPVIDIASLSGTTDIPDWSWYEAGLEYQATLPTVPTSESITKMLACSPICYVENIKCPVLLLIGAKDLRVPPSQSLRFHQYLRSRGVTNQLFLYPEDGHALSTVPCSSDVFVQTVLWFEKYLMSVI